MILIMGTIRIVPDTLAAARPAMHAMTMATRAEDGCIHYAYAEDVLEAGLIRVSELWRDQTSLERHFASAHLAEWRAAWADLGICDRKLEAFDVGESRPS
jgi:quinol monooxygenase YgiN